MKKHLPDSGGNSFGFLLLGFWAVMASLYLLICIINAMPTGFEPYPRPFITRLNRSIEAFGKAKAEVESNRPADEVDGFFGYVIVLPAYLPFLVLYYLIIAPIILLVEFINDRL